MAPKLSDETFTAGEEETSSNNNIWQRWTRYIRKKPYKFFYKSICIIGLIIIMHNTSSKDPQTIRATENFINTTLANAIESVFQYALGGQSDGDGGSGGGGGGIIDDDDGGIGDGGGGGGSIIGGGGSGDGGSRGGDDDITESIMMDR